MYGPLCLYNQHFQKYTTEVRSDIVFGRGSPSIQSKEQELCTRNYIDNRDVYPEYFDDCGSSRTSN